MASSLSSSAAIHVILLLVTLFSVSCVPLPHEPTTKPKPYILPIKKDPATHLFYTTIGLGTPQQNTDLVIDLGGENLWHDCSRKHYNSSSNHKVVCESKKCPKGGACMGTGCVGPYKPGCAINDCAITMDNPFSQFTTIDSMVEDVISLSHTYVPGFLAGCVDVDDGIYGNALQGLPKSTKGIVGFSRSKLSFPSQFVLANKLLPMFSLCFPSSHNLKGFGNIFIGAASGGHPQDESKFLQTTTLVVNPVATGAVSIYGAPSIEYFIHVRSIKIGGHVVKLNPSLLSIDKKGNGGTKISTLTPWTKLHSSLYKPFVQDFVNKAEGRRMKRVTSVAPFDACFDSSTIENSGTGPVVPIIDLVLPGGVQWTIYGANSMVVAGKNVACLAFVDGGMKPKLFSVEASIVIGGHQLEDNLLVIDMASSRLSFSSSLLLRNATCSHV